MLTSVTEAEVDIHGVEGDAYDNVRLMLSIDKEKCGAPKWKIQNLFKKSKQEIDQALRAFGYYHATSSKSLAFNEES
jgi:translocation and assembly module TamA